MCAATAPEASVRKPPIPPFRSRGFRSSKAKLCGRPAAAAPPAFASATLLSAIRAVAGLPIEPSSCLRYALGVGRGSASFSSSRRNSQQASDSSGGLLGLHITLQICWTPEASRNCTWAASEFTSRARRVSRPAVVAVSGKSGNDKRSCLTAPVLIAAERLGECSSVRPCSTRRAASRSFGMRESARVSSAASLCPACTLMSLKRLSACKVASTIWRWLLSRMRCSSPTGLVCPAASAIVSHICSRAFSRMKEYELRAC
mmetsp:Transcript_37496/g.105882  ORF Transcript_37496/g.105882 Transcript_37496/m.105882 type:complete len:259 (-) Transcript_37496:123-899(-)